MIAFATNELEIYEVIAIAAVAQQERRIAIVGNDYIDEAVIIEISKRNTSGNMGT